MVYFAISVVVGTTGNAPSIALESAVSNWIDQHHTNREYLQTDFLHVDKPREDIQPYYEAVWRIDYSSNIDDFLDDLVDRLNQLGVVEWYRVMYHRCMIDYTHKQCGDWEIVAKQNTPEII